MDSHLEFRVMRRPMGTESWFPGHQTFNLKDAIEKARELLRIGAYEVALKVEEK